MSVAHFRLHLIEPRNFLICVLLVVTVPAVVAFGHALDEVEDELLVAPLRQRGRPSIISRSATSIMSTSSASVMVVMVVVAPQAHREASLVPPNAPQRTAAVERAEAAADAGQMVPSGQAAAPERSHGPCE